MSLAPSPVRPAASTQPTDPLSRMRSLVFDRKPFLKNIIDKLGDKSLLEYVHGYSDIQIHPRVLARQEEFLDSFEREVQETLTPEIAKRARAQLKKTYFASTNDHHGPLNAFDAFNAHLLLALSAMTDPKEMAMDAIIVFSCCNVSLNNISFPRGMLFSASTPEGIALRRLSLLPSNSHACCLYGYRAYEPREIQKLEKLLRQQVRDGLTPKHVADKISPILTQVFGDPAIINRKMYSAQSSIINSRLWDIVFKGQQQAPIFVSIGQERLVSRLLQEQHLVKDTLIRRFIFNPDYETKIRKHFDGIYGAFSSKDNSGTYLFWGRSPDNGLRIQMRRDGDKLVSADGTIQVPWTPEAIAAALKARTIIPSILLVFVTLSFYYGLKCLGGYSQVNYLTFMKEAFMAMMQELGEYDDADACVPVSTKNWSGFTFSYLQNPKGIITPAQFMDLHFYADDGMWDRLREYAKTCTLRQSIEPLLPEIYRYSYGEHEREADLLALTPEGIAAETGMKPCLRLS